MSLASWKREFYRKDADEVSERNAVDHSIRKWEGLLKKNLRKHGVTQDCGPVLDDKQNYFAIDADTCALCKHYIDIKCSGCPLYTVRGRVACSVKCNGEKDSPYAELIENGDARPMLMWLRRAKKMTEQQEQTP